jgi:hypothetical protein
MTVERIWRCITIFVITYSIFLCTGHVSLPHVLKHLQSNTVNLSLSTQDDKNDHLYSLPLLYKDAIYRSVLLEHSVVNYSGE